MPANKRLQPTLAKPRAAEARRWAFMSTVVHIFVASKRGAPMSAQQSVEALAEVGLTGDRYSEANNR